MRLTKRDEAIFLLDGFSAGREVRRSRTRVSQNAFYAEEVELVVKRFNTEPHEVPSLSRHTWLAIAPKNALIGSFELLALSLPESRQLLSYSL